MTIQDILEKVSDGIPPIRFDFRGYEWFWYVKMKDYFTVIDNKMEMFSERYNLLCILDQEVSCCYLNPHDSDDNKLYIQDNERPMKL